MPTIPNSTLFSNIPTPPKTGTNRMSFPNDLVSDGRNFCTTINFVSYQSTTTLSSVGNFISSLFSSGGGGAFSSAGNVTLPIPRKLNDQQTIIWTDVDASQMTIHAASSMTGYGGSAALSALGTAAGVGTGLAINPHLWLQFRHPNFKEHTLTWTLAPNNEAESNSIEIGRAHV